MAKELIIEREIKTIFIKQLLRRDVNNNTKLRDIDAIDLCAPKIVLAIEDFFEIDIPRYDWSRLETIGEVVEYVCEHTQ